MPAKLIVTDPAMQEALRGVNRLTRDLATASASLGDHEVRFIVDAYYTMQENRKRAYNQVQALAKDEEPHAILQWFAAQNEALESQLKRALDKYTQGHVMGSWMRAIYGIGPIISAGLLAHIDIERAPTVGHIWSFAGFNPSAKWEKGQKRPWNAQLKTLCWHAGQCFMRFAAQEECVYGHLYRQRKAYEVARNEAGDNAQLAKELAPKYRTTTDAYAHYKEGRLPPAQIDARARRYAVKQFLSDLHHEWFKRRFGYPPAMPYPIAILGHAHYRAPLGETTKELTSATMNMITSNAAKMQRFAEFVNRMVQVNRATKNEIIAALGMVPATFGAMMRGQVNPVPVTMIQERLTELFHLSDDEERMLAKALRNVND